MGELKKTYSRIEHINTVLRAICSANRHIMREKDCYCLLKGVCDILIENRGYHNVWIALLNESGRLETSAEAGLSKDFLPLIEQLKRGELTDCGLRALVQSKVIVTKDPASTCIGCPVSSKYGGRGAMTVRLEYGGKVYGILSASILAECTADEEELALFHDVACDIALALHSIELSEERKCAENVLHESLEKYRNLVNTSTDAIISIDQDMKVTLWNPKAESIFGYTEKDMLGQSIISIVPERYRGVKESGFAKFKKNGFGHTIGKTLELVGLRKDGTEVPVELSVASSKVGETYIATATIRDITDRKFTVAELSKYREQLEELLSERTTELRQEIIEHMRTKEMLKIAKETAVPASLAKSESLINMCQEIRIQLNAIIGFTKILESKIRDADCRMYLSSILSAGKSLLKRVNDILVV